MRASGRFAFGVSAPAMMVALLSSAAMAQSPSQLPATQSSSQTVEEVKVTGGSKSEKQATALQEKPKAATIITQQQIQNAQITSLDGIRKLVPSLTIRWNNVQNLTYNIRGIGNASSSQLIPLYGGTGIYIDGVYFPRPGTWTTDIPDLEGVQVLKGPSATNGGYDDTSGRVLITTSLPSFTEQQKAEIQYGTYNAVQLKATATGPVFDTDWAAFRISVFGKDRDGYIQSNSSGAHGGVRFQDLHDKGARAQLLVFPTQDFSGRFIADWSQIDTKCCVKLTNGIVTNYANGAPYLNGFLTRAQKVGYTPLQILGTLNQFNNYNVDLVTATPTERAETYGISGHLTYNWNDYTFSSLTALRGYDYHPYWLNNQTINVDTVTASHGHPSVKSVQHETKVTTPVGEPIEGSAGLFFYWEDFQSWGLSSNGTLGGPWFQPTQPLVVSNAALSGAGRDSYVHITTTQVAPFAHGVWHATPDIDVTAGVRFSYTGKPAVTKGQTYGASLDGLTPAQRATAIALRAGQFGPAYYYDTFSTHQGLWSGTLSGLYKITPDANVYATYSHGVRPGGPNVSTQALVDGAERTVKPEEVDNFELGFKSTWYDNRLIANFAIFNMIDRNYITNVSVVNGTGATLSYLANARRAVSRGVEADVRARPIDGLEVYGSAIFNDAHFQSFDSAPCPLELSNLSSVGLKTCNFTGKRLAIVSRWSTSVGGQYNQPLDMDIPFLDQPAIGFVGADFNWQSSFYSDASDSQYALINPYGLLNVHAGIKTSDDKWKFTGWVHNALDKHYFTNLQGNLLSAGLIGGTVGDPLMAGASLAVTW